MALVPLGLDELLVLLVGLVLFIELTVVVVRWPVAGAWLLAVGALLATFRGVGGLEFVGVTIYPLDFICAVLAATVLVGLLRGRHMPRGVVVLAVLLVIALLRGIPEFGSETAANASRALLYVVVGIAFATTWLGPEAWLAVRRLWQLMAGFLILVALVFFARNGLGSYASSGERVLNSEQALIVSQAALLALAVAGSRRQRGFTAACLLVVLATQQRTVWAATVVGIVVLAMRAGRLSSQRATRAVRLSVLAVVIGSFTLLLVGPTGLRESVSTATSTVSTSSGTFGWRIEGWGALIDSYAKKPLTDRLVGQPAGTGFTRTIAGGEVTVSPHNMYLTVLLSLGGLGLCALLVLYARALRSSARPSPPLNALAWGVAVFSIGYQIGPEQALILGSAIVGARGIRHNRPVWALLNASRRSKTTMYRRPSVVELLDHQSRMARAGGLPINRIREDT